MAVIVIFRIGSDVCALERGLVRQIAPMPALSRPPLIPPALAGFLNLGGEALPVLRADRLFGAEQAVEGIYSHVLILRIEGQSFGLLVDRVTDVRNVDLSTLRQVDADASLNGCVRGDVTLDDEPVHVLSGDRLLLAAEKTQIEQLRVVAQARLDEWAAV